MRFVWNDQEAQVVSHSTSTEFNLCAPSQVRFQTGPGLVTFIVGAKQQGLLDFRIRASDKVTPTLKHIHHNVTLA